MIAKYLKRLLGSTAIAALTIALAYPAFAQTTYKTGTSVNVGQPSSTQLSRDEINQQEQHDELEEDTHHEQIDEGLDSQARADAISHDLRIKQLEAAQTPYKPQHIADENEQYADEKKDNAQKKAIEAQRHSQALARIEAAAQALLSGAASALSNALNGGGGSPSGTAPQPNGGGSASNPSGGGSASNPSSGGGSPGNRAYPGGAPGGVPRNPALGGGGSPSNPNSGGGSASNPNGGGGSPGNQNASGGSPSNPRLTGGASSNPNGGGNSPGNPNAGNGSPNNPYSGGTSASNPNSGAGSASNPNAGGGTANNPRLTGNASSNANASNASPSGRGAGQRPLDAIPNALNGFVNQFQNGGQNLQNASNAMRGVAQTFEDQWTKPNGGINQVAAMAAFHGIGGALKYLAPAIKGAAADAAANAPAIVAKAAAATTGIVARAKNFAAKLFGRGPPTEPVNPTENLTGGTSAGEPGASNPGENPSSPAEPAPGELGSPQNPLTGAAVSQQWNNLAGQTVKIGDKTFNLGASRGAGTFGTVYENKNTPGTLLKVIRPDEKGIESLKGQVSGDQLLESAKTGIVTPAIDPVSSGGSNALVMQDVKSMFPGAQTFKPTDSVSALNPQQRAAIQNLYNELGKKGIVWADGQLPNVFLYDTPSGLQAGILDTDRIFPVEAFKAQPSYVSGPLFMDVGGRITDAEYMMKMLFNKYYG
jgi:hypothetical protein